MDGIEFFLKNIQVGKLNNKSSFKEVIPPESLKKFLKQIKIPYLFPNINQSSPIVKRVSGFISMRNSYRPPSMVGWDVVFESNIQDQLKKCFIECNLWSTAVGIPTIFKYYKKACPSNLPLSILIAKKLQKSLQNPDVLSGKCPLPEEELKGLVPLIVDESQESLKYTSSQHPFS